MNTLSPRNAQQISRSNPLWRLMAKFSLLAFAALLLTVPATAQFRTSVQGVVTDPDGAVVPGAELTLKNSATNETIVRTSDSAGIFNFNALPSAVFTLTAKKAGFQTQTLDHLEFIPEQANSLTVKMALGQLSETVTVDGSTEPAVDTETSNIGATISTLGCGARSGRVLRNGIS